MLQITQQMIKNIFNIHKRLDKRHKMQNIFTHVNQFYHSLVSAVCRGRIISLNSTPTMRGADCPSFLAMYSYYKYMDIVHLFTSLIKMTNSLLCFRAITTSLFKTSLLGYI